MDKQGLHIDKTAKCLIYNVQNKYQDFQKPQKLIQLLQFRPV